jgi:hypothetical protein
MNISVAGAGRFANPSSKKGNVQVLRFRLNWFPKNLFAGDATARRRQAVITGGSSLHAKGAQASWLITPSDFVR